MSKIIKIGGASGYWGESAMATPQLLNADIDYLVYDYLAEITMSIMARMRMKDPAQGYATDFVDGVIKRHAKQINTKGVKIIANAGGVNPVACGEAVRAVLAAQGIDMKIAVISGDDQLLRKDEIMNSGVTEMFTGAPFPADKMVASINTYLGAFPIAEALNQGADIVITGRCVDSAVTLGACIHEFGWQADDWDALSAGSLVGHLIECGPQVTGGNFTDWQETLNSDGGIAGIGYPIAEITANGDCVITKPDGTGGVVNRGTVAEQMVYEIGDPQAYLLPDVTCDFADVVITDQGNNRVHVTGAIGRNAPTHYKTCMTYADGFRGGVMPTIYGFDAPKKAESLAAATLQRCRAIFAMMNIGDFTETSLELIGAESQFGTQSTNSTSSREVVMKFAVKHPDIKGVGIFLKELSGIGLATPPGLSGFTGLRPKPQPVVRLFSYLTPKDDVKIKIHMDDKEETYTDQSFDVANAPIRPTLPITLDNDTNTDDMIDVPLIQLAYARSGDKGNKANIGIIARDPKFMPYIWTALTELRITNAFAHFIEADDQCAQVEKFYMPGASAMNILIDNILGGGGMASLRNDAQGKGYGQILLYEMIRIPKELLASSPQK